MVEVLLSAVGYCLLWGIVYGGVLSLLFVNVHCMFIPLAPKTRICEFVAFNNSMILQTWATEKKLQTFQDLVLETDQASTIQDTFNSIFT